MAIFSTCQTIELARNSKLRAGPIFFGHVLYDSFILIILII